MSTSFGWEGKGWYGSLRWRINARCAGNCEISWERMPYLGALEVCSRRGAIHIHIYLTLLYLTKYLFGKHWWTAVAVYKTSLSGSRQWCVFARRCSNWQVHGVHCKTCWTSWEDNACVQSATVYNKARPQWQNFSVWYQVCDNNILRWRWCCEQFTDYYF